MNAPSTFAHDASTQAPLSARILAGVMDGLPEHYSDVEWTEAAEEAREEGNEAPLLRMVELGRLQDAHREWQSRGWSEREHDRRQFVDIGQGPLSAEWFAAERQLRLMVPLNDCAFDPAVGGGR